MFQQTEKLQKSKTFSYFCYYHAIIPKGAEIMKKIPHLFRNITFCTFLMGLLTFIIMRFVYNFTLLDDTLLEMWYTFIWVCILFSFWILARIILFIKSKQKSEKVQKILQVIIVILCFLQFIVHMFLLFSCELDFTED